MCGTCNILLVRCDRCFRQTHLQCNLFCLSVLVRMCIQIIRSLTNRGMGIFLLGGGGDLSISHFFHVH